MVMGILRGRADNVSSEKNADEIARTKEAIRDLETEIAEADAALSAGEEQRASLRYRRDVLAQDIGDGIQTLDIRTEELEGKRAGLVKELERRRIYLVRLERPYLKSQEREQEGALGAIRARQVEVVRAEDGALCAYFEAHAASLAWEREGREKAATLNRLRRLLGKSEVAAPVLPSGARLRPRPLLAGESTRPDDYRDAAARLRAVLDAGEADIARAWGAPPRDRSVFDNDLVAGLPAPENVDALVLAGARAAGQAKAARRRQRGL